MLKSPLTSVLKIIEDIFCETIDEIFNVTSKSISTQCTQQKRLVIQGPKGKAKTFVFRRLCNRGDNSEISGTQSKLPTLYT